jgi:hypothetical protein
VVPTFYQVGSSFLLTSAIYLEQIFIIGCSLIDLDKCVPLSLRETMMYINARSVESFFFAGRTFGELTLKGIIDIFFFHLCYFIDVQILIVLTN